jgi:hypothetical protein
MRIVVYDRPIFMSQRAQVKCVDEADIVPSAYTYALHDRRT